MLLIGRAAWEICFNQSKTRSRSGSDTSSLWNFCGRSADVTSRRNSGGVAKYRLFPQARQKVSYLLLNCAFPIKPFTAKFSQKQISTKFRNFISWNFVKQIAPCVSTGRELSFEWSHHRISSTDSKVRVTLQNSIKHSGSERVKPQSVSNPYAQSAFDTLVRTVAIRCIWLHFPFHRLTSATPVLGTSLLAQL